MGRSSTTGLDPDGGGAGSGRANGRARRTRTEPDSSNVQAPQRRRVRPTQRPRPAPLRPPPRLAHGPPQMARAYAAFDGHLATRANGATRDSGRLAAGTEVELVVTSRSHALRGNAAYDALRRGRRAPSNVNPRRRASKAAFPRRAWERVSSENQTAF